MKKISGRVLETNFECLQPTGCRPNGIEGDWPLSSEVRSNSARWWRIWLDAFLIIAVPLAIFWRFPVRLFVSLGALIARYISTLMPYDILLMIAQARLAGLPILGLLAGYVRINDAPAGQKPDIVASEGLLSKEPILKRHTAMLGVPAVIERVVSAAA